MVSLALVTPSVGAADKKVTLTPAKDLVNEQFIQVQWSGFEPSGLVYIRQCTASPKNLADCSEQLANGVSDERGSGAIYYQVREGEYPGRDFHCTSQDPCGIAVMPDADDVKSSVLTRMEFAFPPSSCPDPEGAVISGSGASAVQRAMLTWSATVCREPYTQPVQYTLKNSVDGLRDFVVKLSDYAITGLPFEAEELAKLEKQGRKFAYAPLATSALVFGYRLFDRQSGEQITDLRLTPGLLAEIFTGQIANWNDPRIQELNPGYKFPPQVRPVGRADNSHATWMVTSFFGALAPGAYEAGGDVYGGGPKTVYPSTGAVDLRTGAPGVAQEVARPATEQDTSVYGHIGWMDMSYAMQYGLAMVAVQNAAGEFVTPNDESISAALGHMKPGEGGTLLGADYATTDPEAYPIPTLNYMVVPTNKIDLEQARLFKEFLGYAVGQGQSDLPPGYLPIPRALASQTRDVASLIEGAVGSTSVPGTAPGPAAGTAGATTAGTIAGASGVGALSAAGGLSAGGGSASSAETSPEDLAEEVEGEYIEAAEFREEQVSVATSGDRPSGDSRAPRRSRRMGMGPVEGEAAPVKSTEEVIQLTQVESALDAEQLATRIDVAMDAMEERIGATTTRSIAGEERLLLTTLSSSLESLLLKMESMAQVDGLKERVVGQRQRYEVLAMDLYRRLEIAGDREARFGGVATAPALQTKVMPVVIPSKATLLGTIARAATIFGLVVVLFIAYELFGSSLSEARSQRLLLDDFKLVVASGATEGLPAAGAPVALLEIPELGLEKVVVEGTTSGELQHGPGHLRNSPMPGQPGNAVVAGRRTTFGAPFGDLDRLEEGDEIFITTPQGRFEYEVAGSEIVEAGESDTIGPTTDNRLTLVTSHPEYLGKERLSVTAALEGDPVLALAAPPTTVGNEENGLTGDSRATTFVLIWLQLSLIAGLGVWLLYRRWSAWATYIIGTPVLLALMVLLFENVDRLLPATL